MNPLLATRLYFLFALMLLAFAWKLSRNATQRSEAASQRETGR
jgi:hypothetical protein